MFKEPVMVSHMHAVGPPAKAPMMNVNKSQEVYQTAILLSFVHIKSPLVNVKQELYNFSTLSRGDRFEVGVLVPPASCSGQECCKFCYFFLTYLLSR